LDIPSEEGRSQPPKLGVKLKKIGGLKLKKIIKFGPKYYFFFFFFLFGKNLEAWGGLAWGFRAPQAPRWLRSCLQAYECSEN